MVGFEPGRCAVTGKVLISLSLYRIEYWRVAMGTENQVSPAKKPYQSPKLRTYGDIRQLTLSNGKVKSKDSCNNKS